MTRVAVSGTLSAIATVASAIIATAVVAGVLSGTGSISGNANTNNTNNGTVIRSGSTVFAWELWGQAVAATPVATNASGTISGGTSCPSTCGTGSVHPCCGGWTTRAFNAASTCGTTFGTSGPFWTEESGATKHAVVTAYTGSPPLSLPSQGGNAIKYTANAGGQDLDRFARTIDTQAGSLACVNGLCDGTSDVNTDPMLTGIYYMRVIVWSNAAPAGGTYTAIHLMSGVNFSATCADDKPQEKLQSWGSENSNGKYLMDRTTQGSAEGSHWYDLSSAYGTTPRVVVVKIENDVNASCSGPTDDNGSTVTCVNELHNAVTMWIDVASPGAGNGDPSAPVAGHGRSRVVIAGWKNAHRLNTIEIGGTNTGFLAGICLALNYDDALNCPLPL